MGGRPDEFTARIFKNGAEPYIVGGRPPNWWERVALRACRRGSRRLTAANRAKIASIVGNETVAIVGTERQLPWIGGYATIRCVGADDATGEPEWRIVAMPCGEANGEDR